MLVDAHSGASADAGSIPAASMIGLNAGAGRTIHSPPSVGAVCRRLADGSDAVRCAEPVFRNEVTTKSSDRGSMSAFGVSRRSQSPRPALVNTRDDRGRPTSTIGWCLRSLPNSAIA